MYIIYHGELKWDISKIQLGSVQLLSCVQLFATPWTAAQQASLSITNSWNLLKLNSWMVSDAIQPSHPLSPPSPPAFNLYQLGRSRLKFATSFFLFHPMECPYSYMPVKLLFCYFLKLDL